jgi:hypothetical protein
MKKGLLFIFSLFLITLVSAQSRCTYMGEEISCSVLYDKPLFWILIIGVPLLLFGLIGFWIWMLIDAIKRKFKEDNEKLIWILVLLFANWLGAIIYYFAVKRKG